MRIITFFLIFILFSSCGEDGDKYPVCSEYSSPLFLGSVEDGNLEEISGLVFSSKNSGIFWTHNDSGHTASVYALNSDRKIVLELILEGVEQNDWEDIALGPCDRGRCIFIGDIGDNDSERDSVAIYVLEEPDVNKGDQYQKIMVKDFDEYRFAYKDKSRNAEGLAVDTEGDLYIFSKEEDKSAVFKIPEFKESSVTTLEYVGVISKGMVTAADIHRSGDRLLLMTTDGLFEISGDNVPFSELLELGVETVLTGIDHGEAASYDPDTGYIYYSTENSKGDPPLNLLRCE